jgi:hypothetical protein
MKPGNAGGGKEPQLEANARSDEDAVIRDEPLARSVSEKASEDPTWFGLDSFWMFLRLQSHGAPSSSASPVRRIEINM